MTGSAATLRQQWGEDEKFNLTDPSEYAASTNEVCLLAQYLTEQLQYQLSAIPQVRRLFLFLHRFLLSNPYIFRDAGVGFPMPQREP